MNVGKYQITLQTDPTDHIIDEVYANSFSTRLEIQNEIKQLIEESIISNTDVYLVESEVDHLPRENKWFPCMKSGKSQQMYENEYSYEPRGQEIEVALVKFLIDNDKDIHTEIVDRNKNSPKLC